MISRRLSLWAPFLAALAVGFCLSSIEQGPVVATGWDKVAHATEFTILGILALRAFHGGLTRPRKGPTMTAGIVVVLWAISDEFHQSFVPGRDSTVGDVVADAVGFGIALLLVFAFTHARARRRGEDTDTAL